MVVRKFYAKPSGWQMPVPGALHLIPSKKCLIGKVIGFHVLYFRWPFCAAVAKL